jgi:hypothetical protein
VVFFKISVQHFEYGNNDISIIRNDQNCSKLRSESYKDIASSSPIGLIYMYLPTVDGFFSIL